MKQLLTSILLVLPSVLFSQDITGILKNFYKNADMNYYLDIAQNNLYRERDSIKVWWYGNYPQVFDTYVPMPINLKETQTVPMLAVSFYNTEDFNFSKNIYDYIGIDSMTVFTFACVRKNEKVFAFANFFGGLYAYTDIDKNLSCFSKNKKNALRNVIIEINKYKPELILYCSSMEGFHDNNGFMFIKGDKIYVYRVIESDVYELNEYVKKFLGLERTCKLDHQFIPAIYQNVCMGDTRINRLKVSRPAAFAMRLRRV